MLEFVRVFVHFQHKCEVRSQPAELQASKFPGGRFFMTVAKGPVLKSSKTKFFHHNHPESFTGRREIKTQSLN